MDSLWESLANIRQDFHQHAEPGFEEFRTQAKLREILTGYGIPEASIKTCAKTGLVVDITGTGPAAEDAELSMVCLRADIDALRMTEQTSLPYESENKGCAHMCGHDGHMACLLGAAKLIAEAMDRIPSNQTVRLLFQPAEEGPGGAEVMIAEGCLDGVDEVYGMHNWPTAPLGSMRVKDGAVMAHVAEFEIIVTGEGGHGSQPQFAIDPVITAAHIVTSLQTIMSRNVPYWDTAVISVTMIHSGEVFNVIPETARICGTIRDLSAEVFETIETRMTAIATHTAQAFGATAQVNINGMYPAVVNTPAESSHIQRIAEKVLGPSAVSDDDLPILGAEDFSYYLQKKPGCFFFLGGELPGRDAAMCHSPRYNFNDSITPLSVALWVAIVEDRLSINLGYPELAAIAAATRDAAVAANQVALDAEKAEKEAAAAAASPEDITPTVAGEEAAADGEEKSA